MVDLPSEFRAQVESYRGPLDLLLFLIKREEVDIFDIPIARIVEQYQIYLEILRRVDPNLCGEFLVMAAQLMEIKSKLLLPCEELDGDEDMEDPRLELVRQLLEYKKYKERAMLLEMRGKEWAGRHERPPLKLGPQEIEDVGPINIGNVSVWDLFTVFHRVQLALGQRDPHKVVSADRPIAEYVGAVRELLSARPGRTAQFEDLFADARSRVEAIGFLLAVLEMAKERLILVYQEQIFGPIEVRLREEHEIEAILRERTAGLEEGGDSGAAERFLLEGEGRQAALEPIEEEQPPGEDAP